MNTKKTIRKIFFIGMWLTIGVSMLMLFVAAMSKQERESCKGYTIILKGEQQGNFFLDNADVSALLIKAAKNNIKGLPKSLLNLQEMEEGLEENAWIKDAQLYFDNHAMLQVSVMERNPIARVFTAGGRSFYLDENNYCMPLSEKAIAKVPVFTGFPDKKILNKSDSVLLNDIKTTAQYINAHSFWTSQVAQIDIVPDCGPGCWEFEMTPVVGNHIVKLGTGEEIDKKFNRLFTFYQQVMSRTGFDKYKTVDVRFAGQVVGSKEKNSTTKVVQPVVQNETAAETKTSVDTKKNIIANKPVETKPAKKQVSTNPQPSETPLKDDKKIPKAVMPKRVNGQ